MNKKFLSAILFGALMVTSTGTFVSCKDYDDDIDRIDTELSDLKSQLAALQTKVSEGKWITSLTSTTGGFTVAFNDGSSYTITNGKDGANGEKGETGAAGQDGKNGTTVEVKDGYWYVGGEKTNYVAVTKDELGKVKVPYISETDGYWYFYNEAGEAVKSDYKAIGATYVVDANGVYTLYAPDTTGEMHAIKLPTAGSTLADVELLGSIALAKMDANVSQESIGEKMMVSYAYVAKIQKMYGDKAETTWSAQKTVKKGQVLTTLAPNNTHLLARIDAGADVADMSFTLKNSKGATLPISLGVAKQYSGLLTRASNGLYAIALDNTTDTYAKVADYTNKFSKGLYALVEKSGFVSNYYLEVEQNELKNISEQDVEKVNNKTSVLEDPKDPSPKKVYEVELNKANSISFNEAQYVYDYYVEAVDPTIAKMFGFSANKANGTFTVTKLADNVTTATFDVNVYKLHVNGNIYCEKISIKPLRTLGNEVVYDLGKQQIKKTMKMNVALDKMFAALGDDAAIWKNATLGVNDVEFEIVKDKDQTSGPALSFVYKKANGTNADYKDATQFDVTLSAVDKNAENKEVPTLEVGAGYTITITYKHGTNALNSIKVKFTPVMPALSSYIAKRTALWNNNTLMAYFDDPTASQSYEIASTYDMTKGFTKLGADETKIQFVLDEEQEINGVKILKIKNLKKDMASIDNKNKITIETKYNFDGKDGLTVADRWAYAQELNVKVEATYLGGAYKFSKDEIEAAAFKINVQSALKAGKIVPAAGASITLPAAAAGEVAKLTADMITGYTYNNQPYSLFKTKTSENEVAAYKYSYIYKVEFSSPDPEIYTVTNEAVAPGWDNDTKKEIPSYVAITSKNISQTTTTKINVKVTDMFGYVTTAEIPLTITVGE